MEMRARRLTTKRGTRKIARLARNLKERARRPKAKNNRVTRMESRERNPEKKLMAKSLEGKRLMRRNLLGRRVKKKLEKKRFVSLIRFMDTSLNIPTAASNIWRLR